MLNCMYGKNQAASGILECRHPSRDESKVYPCNLALCPVVHLPCSKCEGLQEQINVLRSLIHERTMKTCKHRSPEIPVCNHQGQEKDQLVFCGDHTHMTCSAMRDIFKMEDVFDTK